MTAAARGLPEVVWAVIIAAAVLVSGVLLRALGRWLSHAVTSDFRRVVREAHKEELDVVRADLDGIANGIASMREEQTEQHATVRAEVQGLGLRLDVAMERLDRIESRVYPPMTNTES